MKAHEAIIAWTPSDYADLETQGQVKVRRITSGSNDWVEEYANAAGAFDTNRSRLRGAASVCRVFMDFHALVIEQTMDPQVVHNAFLVIDEYADAMFAAGTMEGAS